METEGVVKEDAEENISIKEGENKKKLEKIP
jgi:hypothetical protein